MSRASEFLESFQANAPTLPERLSARYQFVSALGHRPESGAFLLRRMEDGELFVLKCDTGGQDLAEEFRILERLKNRPVPEPVDYFEEDGAQYLIRTYLPGQSLAEAWEPGENFCRWADLGAQLCGLLSELHSMEPPVVHRDIKPENVILSPEGKPYLIDFGIARSIKPGRDTDTVHMGTRATAAPEQYGFAQSDQRTDLYALGVTLRWMVTGSYRPEALEDADCPGWIKRFLRKAANFDPADRFPTAAAMGKALTRLSRPAWRSALPAVLVCLLALLLAAGAFFAAGRRPVSFSSPLLEEAVRMELDMPEGPVTRKDLKRVRRLAVVGQELLGEEQAFRCNLCVYVDDVAQYDAPRGDISDISILADMPNLTTLYLCRQEISDISPLAGLPLRELYLYDNQISDLSPLEQTPDIETLYIGSNPFGDLSPIAALHDLRELNLDCWIWYEPETLTPLEGLNLEYLSAGNLYPKDGDWSFLRTMERLHTLWLWDPSWTAVEGLEGCDRLWELKLGDYQLPDLTDLPVLPNLLFLAIFNRLPSIEGVQKQASLRWISLCNQEGVDLAPAAALPALKELNIHNVSTTGFGPLLEAPALEKVVVDAEAVRAAMEADCPGHRFEITVF